MTGPDRQREAQIGTAGNAFNMADQPMRPDLQNHGRADLRIGRHMDRNGQQLIAGEAEVAEFANFETRGRWPVDRIGGMAVRKTPLQSRRQSRIAGVDPVGVPLRLVLQVQAEPGNPGRHEHRHLADQVDAQVVGNLGCGLNTSGASQQAGAQRSRSDARKGSDHARRLPRKTRLERVWQVARADCLDRNSGSA